MTWSELFDLRPSVPSEQQFEEACVWPPDACPAAQAGQITGLGMTGDGKQVLTTGKIPLPQPTSGPSPEHVHPVVNDNPLQKLLAEDRAITVKISALRERQDAVQKQINTVEKTPPFQPGV